MQLYEVDEVQELFNVTEVNEALQEDWRIVGVVSSAKPGTGERAVVACYVLGRKVNPEPPKGEYVGGRWQAEE